MPPKRSARYRQSSPRPWHYGVFFVLVTCWQALLNETVYEHRDNRGWSRRTRDARKTSDDN